MLTAARWLAVLAATATGVAGAAAILAQAGSGAQPWDPELSDNFVFMKAIPFLLALGVTLGLVRHRAGDTDRGRDEHGHPSRRGEPAHALPRAGLSPNVWNDRSRAQVGRSAAGASRQRWSLLTMPWRIRTLTGQRSTQAGPPSRQ